MFLNLSADHLDRHPSFEAYAAAKARIFAQPAAGRLGGGQRGRPAACSRWRARAARAPLPFHPPARRLARATGRFFADGDARLRRDGRTETLFALRRRARCPGAHLACDLLAAAAAARLLGAPAGGDRARGARASAASSTCSSAWPTIGGVAFYNDSKATNVEAARKSLEALRRAGAR